MRLLVTGGSGFLGSAFVRAARVAGHESAVLTRQKIRGAVDEAPEEMEPLYLSGSMADPPWRKIEEFAPEVCIHAAWIATPGVYLESPENERWVLWSRDFFKRLLALGIRHALVLGTCVEYQNTGRPQCEDTTPLAAASLYARCKQELNFQLRQMLAERQTPLSWARIYYPYGEGEHPAKLTSSLIAKLFAGEPVTLKTPHSMKDYIHADDIASALLTLVERRFDGPVNIGTGEGVMVETLARKLAALADRPDLVHVARIPVIDPLDFVVADATRLRAFGWRPQVALDAGLRRLVEANRR